MSQDRGFSPSCCRPTPEITKLYDTKTLILVRTRLILMSLTGGSDIRKPRKREDSQPHFGDYQKWGLRDLRQDPLLPCASFSMKLHLAPSPIQENSLGWRALADRLLSVLCPRIEIVEPARLPTSICLASIREDPSLLYIMNDSNTSPPAVRSLSFSVVIPVPELDLGGNTPVAVTASPQL